MKAVLLPNMVEYHAVSMKRYARELAQFLPRVAPAHWEFDEIICHHDTRALRLFGSKLGPQMASRAGRFLTYPQMAKQAKGDVFHILDHSHANLVAALNTEKTVLTCHDLIPYLASLGKIPIPGGRMTRYTFPQRIKQMQKCRFIVTISESTKRDLMEYAGIAPEKIAVVYYGVNPTMSPVAKHGDADARARALRQKLGLPDGAKVILQVATGTRYKNTPALLQAFSKLQADGDLGQNLYLVRVGSELFDDEAELAQNLGVVPRLIFAGRVMDDEILADYYRMADVFAFPSLYEGFGWPPLESMACGTPPVASNVASLPEAVGDGGITVDPQDWDGLASGLRRVLTDAAFADDLRAKSLSHAARFSWEKCARETLAVYDEIVSNP